MKIIKPRFFSLGFFVYICIVIKRNIMRYLVKFYNGTQIINDLQTNELSAAIVRESKLAEKYGRDNVWIADSVTEILVG